MDKEIEGDWDIHINSREAAEWYARLGANTGFIYTAITTAIIYLAMFLSLDQFANLEQNAKLAAAFAPAVWFAIHWILSIRTYSGKAPISSILLFGAYVSATSFAIFSMLSQGLVPGLIALLLIFPIGYLIGLAFGETGIIENT